MAEAIDITQTLDSLHDGHLDAILINRNQKTVTLHCETPHGSSVRIEVTGVLGFCADNLRAGNIILFAQVFTEMPARTGSRGAPCPEQSNRNRGSICSPPEQ
jgi:hypothetical protein